MPPSTDPGPRCDRSPAAATTPQTTGKVERFQQTLKNWLGNVDDRHRVAADLTELRASLDEFCLYYNEHRPHHGIGRVTRSNVGERALALDPPTPRSSTQRRALRPATWSSTSAATSPTSACRSTSVQHEPAPPSPSSSTNTTPPSSVATSSSGTSGSQPAATSPAGAADPPTTKHRVLTRRRCRMANVSPMLRDRTGPARSLSRQRLSLPRSERSPSRAICPRRQRIDERTRPEFAWVRPRPRRWRIRSASRCHCQGVTQGVSPAASP